MALIPWYLCLTLLGLIGLPLTRRLLPALDVAGSAFSRALALLVCGYGFWILVSLGLLPNTLAGVVVVVLLFAGLVWRLFGNPLTHLNEVWRADRALFLAGEGVFLLLFLGLAFLRSIYPQISGTEKPMELAFINSILSSSTFPPRDPWLSGYAVSYYYFGYLLTAFLVRCSGVASGVGFNLMVATVFALTGSGLYAIAAVVLDRVNAPGRSGPKGKTDIGRGARRFLLPLFAPFLTLVVSNLEGVLEFLHARGLFWSPAADGTLVSPFWRWLDIQELTQPPPLPFPNWPQRPGGIVWWRASRVLSDLNFSQTRLEVIDEFPFFSFLLADLHPHVLALPFAVLLIALALNLLLREKVGDWRLLGLELPITPFDLASMVLLLGAMAFLNTWDFPITLFLVLCAVLIRSLRDGGKPAREIRRVVLLGCFIVLGSVALYLPFFLSFSSQAGGFLPSYLFITRGVHFWIMFGTLLIPILLLLIVRLPDANWGKAFGRGMIAAALVVLGILAFGLGAGVLASYASSWLKGSGAEQVSNAFMALQGAVGVHPYELFQAVATRRLGQPGTLVTLLLVGLPTAGLLSSGLTRKSEPRQPASTPVYLFLWLIILVGALLTLLPESIYLRDQFGWRMNTIFKFYYQAWLLWSLAGGISVAILWRDLRRWPGILVRVLCLGLVAAGLAYPVLAIPSAAGQVSIDRLNLDGTAYVAEYNPEEAEAIAWLKQADAGVLLEAVGGSYSGGARVSTLSGQPTVLGWPGHESQWRGGADEMGSRQADIERVYTTADWPEARQILEKYGVTYVYLGGLERSTYSVEELKFQQHLPILFSNGSVQIFGFHPGGKGTE